MSNHDRAVQLYLSVCILDYNTYDKVNEDVLGILGAFLYDGEDEDEADYITDRLVAAFSEHRVKEVYSEMLLEYEKYEELHTYNILIGE